MLQSGFTAKDRSTATPDICCFAFSGFCLLPLLVQKSCFWGITHGKNIRTEKGKWEGWLIEGGGGYPSVGVKSFATLLFQKNWWVETTKYTSTFTSTTHNSKWPCNLNDCLNLDKSDQILKVCISWSWLFEIMPFTNLLTNNSRLPLYFYAFTQWLSVSLV